MERQDERERYEIIHNAVSHGALEHEPDIADDVMFLCGVIRELDKGIAELEADRDELQGRCDLLDKLVAAHSIDVT